MMFCRSYRRLASTLPVVTTVFCPLSFGSLEEVTVSAQRREEPVHEVPISVSVVSGDAFETLGILDFQGLTERVVGAELFDDRGANQPAWVIRGVGLADFNANNAPAASIFYDEFYLPSNILNGVGLFDIHQINVLKGPQGGLYGRNTTGGAVQILSKRPESKEQSGLLQISRGSWDRTQLRGFVNLSTPSQDAAFRVSTLIDQGGGWQDSLNTNGDDKHGDRDFFATRIQFLTSQIEHVDVLIKLDVGRDLSETTLGVATGAYSDPADGRFCDAIVAGNRDDALCLTWSNYTSRFLNQDVGPLPSAQSDSGSSTLSNPINDLENDWFGVNINIDWALAKATISWIGAYIDLHSRQRFDFDATGLQLGHEDSVVEIDAWSQEFRVASEAGMQWSTLGGIVYASDQTLEGRRFDFADNILVFGGFPGSNRGFVQNTESLSLYGQAKYEISDAFALQGSLRHTYENKELENGFTNLDTGGAVVAFFQGASKKYTLDRRWSGDANALWTFREGALLYAKVARSIKSGGFFGGFALSPEELDPYEEETVWAYSAGLKFASPNRTLLVNSEAFFYNFDNVQGFLTTASDVTGTALTKLGNIGMAEHFGAELEIAWSPRDAAGAEFYFGVSWLDASITRSDAMSVTQDGRAHSFEGLRRQFAPEWSATTSITYDFSLPRGMRTSLAADYSWRTALADARSFPSAVDEGLGHQNGYGLLGIRVAISSPTKGWEFALSGKNIGQANYVLRSTRDDVGSYIDIPGQPMRWQISYTHEW